MNADQLTRALRAEQGDGGGFACRVVHPDGRVEPDRNAFATALVLRELAHVPADARIEAIKQRALDSLERCAEPRMPGAYGFWPVDERPAWGRSVPADCDDTAVVSLELLRAGRRSMRDTRDTVYDVLVASLCTEVAVVGPRWIRPFTFPTWLDAEFRGRANPIDCAVNVNVLALMAICDLRDLPGYAESIAMIDEAIAQLARCAVAERPRYLRSLTPYYPDPRVFAIVLEHAVACGVDELDPARQRLRRIVGPDGGEPHLLCGNAYGGPSWVCPAFELVRGLRARARPASRGAGPPSRMSAEVTA